MASGGNVNQSLQETPTWALATVCFVFIFLGILIEHLIHLSGLWLKKRKKAALHEAIERLKSVLMQLGFMSLILTVTQRQISKICVHNNVAVYMLPCRRQRQSKTTKALEHLLLSIMPKHERILASADSSTSASLDHCSSKGMTSLISEQGLNQLNIFIFVLAAMQILYSVITMGLGRAKMKKWKTWEMETQSVEYLAANDPQRFRFTRQTTFWRRHVGTFATNSTQLWIKCFFRQFFNSVAKIDYFTLRHGFISAHLSTNNSFNFRKYIQRSLEDDFKVVVGISPAMWFLVVIFLLVDVHGWNIYLWVSFVPLIIVLSIGTKLEVIVGKMAMQLTDRNSVIKGAPLVQPDNNYFWFKRPQLVLTLLHLSLFMNAFELSFFIWVTWQYGIKSCYHENVAVLVIRIVLAVMVQIICSYITLPLYALITQMGSQFRSTILEDHTVHAIKQWHEDVKQKKHKKDHHNDDNMARSEDNNTNNIQENSTSSALWINNSSTNDNHNANNPTTDNSLSISHHREPTFAEFTSSNHEIMEDV